jgi:hypothetical protein
MSRRKRRMADQSAVAVEHGDFQRAVGHRQNRSGGIPGSLRDGVAQSRAA